MTRAIHRIRPGTRKLTRDLGWLLAGLVFGPGLAYLGVYSGIRILTKTHHHRLHGSILMALVSQWGALIMILIGALITVALVSSLKQRFRQRS